MSDQVASDPQFETEFRYRTAIGPEPGATRRDASPVIHAGELHYVWYSKATRDPTGYYATVWYATSPDGLTWTEQGEAIPTGPDDAWDANGVFTPTTLIAEGKYWLYYTAVPKPFTNDDGGPNSTPTAIGAAWAESPDGPWTKLAHNPLLRPGPAGQFDSHRVDDACMIVRGGKYRLYYKGREAGLSPAETKMGLAVADSPAGPFVKHAGNPVLGSGHEVCVWPHGRGIAALVAPCGPEGSTIQYSEDGISFVRKARVAPPMAPGPYRTDAYQDVDFGEGITWGICHDQQPGQRPYLQRFDCDLRARR